MSFLSTYLSNIFPRFQNPSPLTTRNILPLINTLNIPQSILTLGLSTSMASITALIFTSTPARTSEGEEIPQGEIGIFAMLTTLQTFLMGRTIYRCWRRARVEALNDDGPTLRTLHIIEGLSLTANLTGNIGIFSFWSLHFIPVSETSLGLQTGSISLGAISSTLYMTEFIGMVILSCISNRSSTRPSSAAIFVSNSILVVEETFTEEIIHSTPSVTQNIDELDDDSTTVDFSLEPYTITGSQNYSYSDDPLEGTSSGAHPTINQHDSVFYDSDDD
ncbi:hypothetical protein CLAVI_000528 [Candidatus Clavichlamydia salmonicola]|uniref:hypothetical protein n=1 Tax=Candidatus Clavichlamydia salmonicola TaxID=469812 RepID=UPI0018912907|nr:hypothetical protein [Candidatus Clavichlamydia salmonicola]MBF5050906.1 hypothetical protein [Candidatus Clavichlamydia salmonicola]